MKDLTVPFRIESPLTNDDGKEIADATRGLLRSNEHIHVVEAVPCSGNSCGEGIEARAEALVLTSGSDTADAIQLCKRSGRWIASRPTAEVLRAADCPDSQK